MGRAPRGRWEWLYLLIRALPAVLLSGRPRGPQVFVGILAGPVLWDSLQMREAAQLSDGLRRSHLRSAGLQPTARPGVPVALGASL